MAAFESEPSADPWPFSMPFFQKPSYWYVCLQTIYDGKKNVVPEVWEVLDKIKGFSNKVTH